MSASTQARIEESVRQYVAAQKKWKNEEYRIEHHGTDAASGNLRVWVVYLEDERNPVPGGGHSVELYVEPSSLRIVKELGFQ